MRVKQPTLEQMVTSSTIAAELGVSRATVNRWTRAGYIPAMRVQAGSQVRYWYRRSEVRSALEGQVSSA